MGLYDHSDDKIYVVTLKDHKDLENFYNDMRVDGKRLSLKRPISRNTHYWLNSSEAEELRSDSRVEAVEINIDDDPLKKVGLCYTHTNNTVQLCHDAGNGTYEKSNIAANHNELESPWAHFFSSRQNKSDSHRSGTWGYDTTHDLSGEPPAQWYNDGKHVDVVIVDNPVSYDCGDWREWSGPNSRFVQYEWFNELNQYVSSIDDDGQVLPTGNYTYHPNTANQTYHGTHVAGTIAGRHYGWAKEANIYSLHVNLQSGFGSPLSSLLVFDYLRAFHRYKPINPLTGKKNPTITNHSWGSGWDLYSYYERDLVPSDIHSVTIRGTTYDVNNPGPSGWTMSGLEKDFGIGAQSWEWNADNAGSRADCKDAIDDGVVVIAAAGNNDQYHIKHETTAPAYADWNNKITWNLPGIGASYINHHRGMAPGNAEGCVTVGSIGHHSSVYKSSFSNYGPGVDAWAPGSMIDSVWPDPSNIYNYMNGNGYTDSKYGAGNWHYPISGTSMASPQVAGLMALAATGKERFTNSDVIAYIQQHGISDMMNVNALGGLFDDMTSDATLNTLHQPISGQANTVNSINPRPTTGHIDGWYKETLKGHRRASYSFQQAQMYPRTNTFYRPLAQELNKNFPIAVTNLQSNSYVINGDDRSTSHTDVSNATLNVKVGDTITFNVNAAGHPFWISISQSTGQPGSGLQPSGITNNGDDQGTITWNTTGNLTGTYYYNCEHHAGMTGTIFVNQ